MALSKEVARPLGSRVYQRHRRMITKLAKKKMMPEAEVVRVAIEDMYSTAFNE